MSWIINSWKYVSLSNLLGLSMDWFHNKELKELGKDDLELFLESSWGN
jgi:hypothetical protein